MEQVKSTGVFWAIQWLGLCQLSNILAYSRPFYSPGKCGPFIELPFVCVLGTEFRDSHMLCMCSTTELHPSISSYSKPSILLGASMFKISLSLFNSTRDWTHIWFYLLYRAEEVFKYYFFFFFETVSYCQAGLELKIFLPQPSELWDYRCVPPHLACFYRGRIWSSGELCDLLKAQQLK
jgi:hypothetical protein